MDKFPIHVNKEKIFGRLQYILDYHHFSFEKYLNVSFDMFKTQMIEFGAQVRKKNRPYSLSEDYEFVFTSSKQIDEVIEWLDTLLMARKLSATDSRHSFIDDFDGFSKDFDSGLETSIMDMINYKKHNKQIELDKRQNDARVRRSKYGKPW